MIELFAGTSTLQNTMFKVEKCRSLEQTVLVDMSMFKPWIVFMCSLELPL